MITRKAYLKTIAFGEAVLIHDGNMYEDRNYFTSINGLIMQVKEHEGKSLYNESMVLVDEFLIRNVHETEDGNTIGVRASWCRGIYYKHEYIATTVGGRYGESEEGFRIMLVDKNGGVMYSQQLTSHDEMGYITGFGVHID
jgi:hypothetical protein